ncbi:cation transporter [Tepidimonas charontis]|uniref:Zinc transporter ZitB n=1 Tax=Tepidimonas charontis TaxID=2267262 RepID=A0A554XC61_9BURK|nr:cation transporter [Tepidimonas charontis]TSE33425.1 Zinc transporter ZitB [Tepidimonas charontis]
MWHRSVFTVPKMDCPSEENLIRMALRDLPQARLTFDLAQRRVTVLHTGPAQAVLQRLTPLNLGAALVHTEPAVGEPSPGTHADATEARVLWTLLAINAMMFVLEMVVGLLAQSTGVLADGMDMFADAAVYGVALYAVGRSAAHKMRAAHLAGWLQGALALLALAEVVRRAVLGSEPVSVLMMAVATLALAANVACLWLVARHRGLGVHMKASYIFSANDVLANLGVIVAGLLVAWTGSALPDLIVGTVIGLIVLDGARRILALR